MIVKVTTQETHSDFIQFEERKKLTFKLNGIEGFN
jgi:hypothetical protein